MINDYATMSGGEVWNTVRLATYLETVGSPFDTGPAVCACGSITAADLGAPTGYGTPAADPAPWYDTRVPASGEFLGFLPLNVDGVDGSTSSRAVSAAVGGGGVFGARQPAPRTMTVQGILVGSTCCGAAYGLRWLERALIGCTGESCDACSSGSCDGDSFAMLDCCPDDGPLTPAQFMAEYRRTFRRTALVSGPTVVRRDGGTNCQRSSCAAGAEIVTVEFVLSAAVPYPYTDPLPRLDVDFPADTGSGDCVDWCVVDPEDPEASGCTCIYAACTDGNLCADPMQVLTLPPAPVPPDSGFCVPLAPDQVCYSLDLSDRARWSDLVPTITVFAGAGDLRNVRVQFFANPDGEDCATLAESDHCDPAEDLIITFIPAGGTVTFDGQTGRATVDCGAGDQPSLYSYGSDEGGPVDVDPLTCDTYCVCLSADPNFPPDPAATVSISTSSRGY